MTRMATRRRGGTVAALDAVAENKELISKIDVAQTILDASGTTDTAGFSSSNPTTASGRVIVTPARNTSREDNVGASHASTDAAVRRSLFTSNADVDDGRVITATSTESRASSFLVTPERRVKRKSRTDEGETDIEDGDDESTKQRAPKRRLLFGRLVTATYCQPNVKKVYSIVRKLTGAIGGNGYSGPIYGELTMASMQKMVDHMVEHAEFDSSSRFIDVGSGIGKPNLHVAQYPGVEYSCGVELEHVRWKLGMVCLKAVLSKAVEQRRKIDFDTLSSDEVIQGNCAFLHRNIMEASSFDPFTHVYMFSIGFPPALWEHLSNMWNSSSAKYLICYLNPRELIETYDFNVELVTRLPTSMHGSKEGHLGYIYRRVASDGIVSATVSADDDDDIETAEIACDPVFQESFNLVRAGLEPLHASVAELTDSTMNSRRSTRSRGLKLTR